MERRLGLCWSGFLLLGTLYALGEVIQLLQWGPRWLRFHLSDFGFTFAIGLLLHLLFGVSLLWAYTVAYLFAMALEIFQFSTNKGDLLDILAMSLSFTIAIIIVRIIGRAESYGG